MIISIHVTAPMFRLCLLLSLTLFPPLLEVWTRQSVHKGTSRYAHFSVHHRAQLNTYQGLEVDTPYTNFGCAFPTDTVVSSPVGGGDLLDILSISSCLDACNSEGYRYAIVTNLAVSLCQCSANVEILSPSVCGLARNYIYVNQNVAPSGVARKRMLEAKKRAQKVGLCPAGLSACRVDQGEFSLDAFEVSL